MRRQFWATLLHQRCQSEGRHQILQLVVGQFREGKAGDGERVNPRSEFLEGEKLLEQCSLCWSVVGNQRVGKEQRLKPRPQFSDGWCLR